MSNLLIILFLVSISPVTQAEVKILSPKNEDWLNHLTETQDLKLEVTGEILKIPTDSVVQVSFNDEISKLKIDKKGKFKYEVNLESILDLTKNKIKVDVLKNGKRLEGASVNVYCCSDFNYGYFQELTPNKAQVVTVKNINNEINNITVNIPQESVRGPANIFVTVKRDAPSIPATKYSPLSLPIAFGVNGNYHFSENVEYGLVAHFDQPRSGFGEVSDILNWENRGYDFYLPWKTTDLKKYKVVILAYSNDWKEIKPTKIDGNKVYFKLPKDHNFDRFLPAAVLKD
jgi:hypothetical protein